MAKVLASLTAAQARDGEKLRRRKREVRATDLHRRRGPVDGPTDGERILASAPADGPEPWQIAAAREGAGDQVARAAVLIGFTPTWGEAVSHYDPSSGLPCPGCGGTKLRRGEACVVCHATRDRPAPRPMQTFTRIAEIMRWPLRARVQRLRGGTGRGA